MSSESSGFRLIIDNRVEITPRNGSEKEFKVYLRGVIDKFSACFARWSSAFSPLPKGILKPLCAFFAKFEHSIVDKILASTK